MKGAVFARGSCSGFPALRRNERISVSLSPIMVRRRVRNDRQFWQSPFIESEFPTGRESQDACCQIREAWADMPRVALAYQRVPLGSSLKGAGNEREDAGGAMRIKTALYSAGVVLGLLALSLGIMILIFYLTLPGDAFK
jgi:hypothetical protein